MFTTPKLRFRLRFADSVEPNEGGEGESKSGTEGDLGFPANTPVKEMTPDQQTAYWKDKARKHEKNRAPDNLAELIAAKAELDRIQAENQTPDERAVTAARTEGRREGASALLHDSVRAELRAHRPHLTNEELDEFLEDVALDNFLGTDGRLDTERVTRLAGKLAAPAPDGDTPKNDPPIGGTVLGAVLGLTHAPKPGNEGSVDFYRQQEAERYAGKTNQ